MLADLDSRLLAELNSAVFRHPLVGTLFTAVAENSLIRGFPIFFPLVAVWFSHRDLERRGRILAGLIAACLATCLSVWCQVHLPTHLRPFLNPHLAVHDALGQNPAILRAAWGTRLYSFPSDTGVVFFTLSTVVFRENRWAGVGAFLWSFFAAGVVRVAMGWHYPSDILGALILAPAATYGVASLGFLRRFLVRQLEAWKPHMYLVHAALFIFLADAYTLFLGLQNVAVIFRTILHYLLGR